MTSIKSGASFQALHRTERREDQGKSETKTTSPNKSGGAPGPKHNARQSFRNFVIQTLAVQGHSLESLVGKLGGTATWDSGLMTGLSRTSSIAQAGGTAFGSRTSIAGLFPTGGTDTSETETPYSRFNDKILDDIQKNVDERKASEKKLRKRQADGTFAAADLKFAELLREGSMTYHTTCMLDEFDTPIKIQFGSLNPNPLLKSPNGIGTSVVMFGPPDVLKDWVAFLQEGEDWDATTVAIAELSTGRWAAPDAERRSTLLALFQQATVEKARFLAFTQGYSTSPDLQSYKVPGGAEGTIRCEAGNAAMDDRCPSQAGPANIDHPAGISLEEMLAQPVTALPGGRSIIPIDTSRQFTYPSSIAPFYKFDASGVKDMPAPSIFKGWESIDSFIYYGGAKSEGQILCPSKDWIDAAHQNGKPILGTVDFQTDYYGGEAVDYDKWMAKDASGKYLLALKFVDWAKQNGFDGWLFSFETTAHSGQKKEFPKFLSAMKEYAQSMDFPFTIGAYGAAKNGGGTLGQMVTLFSDDDGNLTADFIYVDVIRPGDKELLEELAGNGVDVARRIRARVNTEVDRCFTPEQDPNDARMATSPAREDYHGYWIWGADDYKQDKLAEWLQVHVNTEKAHIKRKLTTGEMVAIALGIAAALAAAGGAAVRYRQNRAGQEEEAETDAVTTTPERTDALMTEIATAFVATVDEPREENGPPLLPVVVPSGDFVVNFS